MNEYLMDGHKLLWHLDRVMEWQRERLICPIYVEVSPVSFCNHKCIFCGIDFAMAKGVRLETKNFCKKLKEMGKMGLRSIMFAGEGEPLLHEDLPLFIKTAKMSGIDVSLTTNGTKGNYELWKKILPYLTWVRFSVDAGTKEVYTKVHNVPAAFFDRTLNSIKEAIKVKRKDKLPVTIGVQFLMIKENLCDIENAVQVFSCLGVDYLSLKPYSLHPQMIKRKDTVYTEETMRYVKEIVGRYKGKRKTDLIFREEAMRIYMERQKKFSHCRALPFWGYISSKGDFYTCSVFINDKRFKAGNIYNDNIGKIFYGRRRKKSVQYGEGDLRIADECRLNCRMARINEFLEFSENKPEHVNFI
jgi:radical SAM protein with 4Fe4S-binding SPASM domain